MIHPEVMIRRASAIMEACGGYPDRKGPLTPRTEAAWSAWHVGWYLMHARDDLHFLRLARPRGVDSLAWHYRAYASKKRAARRTIRIAARCLAQAEAEYASSRRAAA